MPVEAFEVEVTTPPTVGNLSPPPALEGLETAMSCFGSTCFTATFDEDCLAGDCLICWRKVGFSGVIVTPPPGGFAGTPGTTVVVPAAGFGAMGMGDRRAVPPGEKSCRRALDPGEASRSWREERGDSKGRYPRVLSLGWIRGEVPDVLMPLIGVGKATSL